MPTDTFYRLPEEKQMRLKDAILKELARVPFADISINRIIQTAEIPRGSYYQYFSDKNDLLTYILQEYKNSMLGLARQCRRETAGNPFELCRILFNYTVKYGLDKEHFAVFRNVISSLRLSDLLAECGAEICGGELFAFGCERERLQWEILLAVFKESVAKLFTLPADAEQIQDDFEQKLNLLQMISEES